MKPTHLNSSNCFDSSNRFCFSFSASLLKKLSHHSPVSSFNHLIRRLNSSNCLAFSNYLAFSNRIDFFVAFIFFLFNCLYQFNCLYRYIIPIMLIYYTNHAYICQYLDIIFYILFTLREVRNCPGKKLSWKVNLCFKKTHTPFFLCALASNN